MMMTIVSSFVPSAITRPFFELQTPDFAWKFVWTVPTNYEKKIVITYIRNYVITKFILHNLSGQSIHTSMQNLESVAQKMSELWH